MSDWREVARVVVSTWPGQVGSWEPETLAGYVAELEARGLTPGQAIAAVRSSDSQFPLAAGALAALVPREGGGHPDAEAAWALIEQAVRMVGRSVYAADFAVHHQAAVDWLADRDPAVAWWAARRGLCGAGSLGAEPVGDAEHGGAVRHRLAGEYREVRARVEEREALGFGLARSELLVRSTARSGGGMADVVAGLAPAPELEAGS